MEPFKTLTGLAAPLDRPNVDTDQIIPKQFLKRIERTGFGQFLFFDWRFLGDGKTPNPEFELNRPAFRDAQILVTGKNFGCGSSREHAPWALLDYGFRVIVAPSYADIFFNNCFQNGILPIVLAETEHIRLLEAVQERPGLRVTVDLPEQTIASEATGAMHFDIDPFRKFCLENGLDDIGLSLQHAGAIDAYELARPAWKRGAAEPA